MVRARPPKKLRRVCRMIFQMIEKNEKTTFPVKPHCPRGIIALIFEGSKVFVLNAGDVSPFTVNDFLHYQNQKDRVVLRVPNHENQKISCMHACHKLERSRPKNEEVVAEAKAYC